MSKDHNIEETEHESQLQEKHERSVETIKNKRWLKIFFRDNLRLKNEQ